jgi:hypothetical protein
VVTAGLGIEIGLEKSNRVVAKASTNVLPGFPKLWIKG